MCYNYPVHNFGLFPEDASHKNVTAPTHKTTKTALTEGAWESKEHNTTFTSLNCGGFAHTEPTVLSLSD